MKFTLHPSLYNDGLRAGWSRNRGSICALNFSVLHNIQTGSKTTKLPTQWVSGALSPWVKRPWRVTDHSPPSSAEIKSGSVPPLPHVFMA
jgi:hypothetical protein